MAEGTNIPAAPIADKDGELTLPWAQVFGLWQRVVLAVRQSGTTANRPTKYLWVGRPYYDTDLGKPVWVHDATSSPAVWHDAAGSTV